MLMPMQSGIMIYSAFDILSECHFLFYFIFLSYYYYYYYYYYYFVPVVFLFVFFLFFLHDAFPWRSHKSMLKSVITPPFNAKPFVETTCAPFLAHLGEGWRWAIVVTCCPSSSVRASVRPSPVHTIKQLLPWNTRAIFLNFIWRLLLVGL